MIGTKLERFMSGTEFCALNETIIMNEKIQSHECFAKSERNGKKAITMLLMSERFMSGIERERSGTERNGAERER